MQKLIQGIEVRKLEKHADERGFLCEILRKDWDLPQFRTHKTFTPNSSKTKPVSLLKINWVSQNKNLFTSEQTKAEIHASATHNR